MVNQLSSLIFNTEIENKHNANIKELEENLEVWTNTQFILNVLTQNETLPNNTFYSSSINNLVTTNNNNTLSNTSLSSPSDDTLTYENMVNYLDIELPQQFLSTINSKQKEKKESINEERRKKNTLASAKFRIKKRQREQQLEKATREMQDKSKGLENRVQELESEIKFLKTLLIEKK